MPRVGGRDKVTGRTKFTADVSVPDRLWGAILRSPLPHARIVHIDVSRARAMPGAHAALSGRDIGERLFGRALPDIPALAFDRVRYIGEPVAAVAAETPEQAQAALDAIQVEYEALPAVFEPFEATRPDAPLIHPNFKQYNKTMRLGNFAAAGDDDLPDIPNLASYEVRTKGDIEQGFRESDVVLEHSYRTSSQHQGYIEPHTCQVLAQADGSMRIWASNKAPFTLRDNLARDFGVEPSQIVVEPMFVGGDYGGKGSVMHIPLAYYLSRACGRPVMIVMDHVAEFTAANPRHPAWITIRSGIKKDGTLVARHVKMTCASGAYAGYKPIPLARLYAAQLSGGVYRVPHFKYECSVVYTNHVPAGHMRSPGGAQVSFAVEVDTDRLAEAAGMDPLEFRLHNGVEQGDLNHLGERWTSIRLKECLQAAKESSGWGQPKPPNVGRGIAASQDVAGAGGSSTEVQVYGDGRVRVKSAVNDQGSGSHTLLVQIVANELQRPIEAVELEFAGTASEIWDRGSSAMSVTHVAGQATLRAVTEMRQKLCAVAAEYLGCPENLVELRDGVFRDPERIDGGLSFEDVAERACQRGEPLTAFHRYEEWKLPTGTGFVVQVAEVEVDPGTGQVHVRRISGAADTGTVINPANVIGQLEGAMAMGLGFGVMEEIKMSQGRVETVGLHDYKLPTFCDVPPLDNVLVTSGEGPGPYGAKGVAELGHIPTPAAIANAVYNAVGVRITDLPVTAEKVYKALQEKAREEAASR